MKIRQATYADIDSLMEIFEAAKQIMRASGNLQQWTDGYPTREVVMRDIDGGHCYVMCGAGPECGCAGQTDCSTSRSERILGTMALIPGPDPTYSYIEGEWPGDEPYYVIHRIATAAPGRNVGKQMLDWAFEHISEHGCHVIRIDTHRDNCIMKHILAKYGFTMCGVIYLADGAPRDAYYLKSIA
jgi:L-amino acid N-acyltransferase YncA